MQSKLTNVHPDCRCWLDICAQNENHQTRLQLNWPFFTLDIELMNSVGTRDSQNSNLGKKIIVQEKGGKK